MLGYRTGAGSSDWQGHMPAQHSMNEFKIKVTCRMSAGQTALHSHGSRLSSQCGTAVSISQSVSERVRQVLTLSDYQPLELSADQKDVIGLGGSRSAGDGRGDTPELEWDFVTFLLVRHMASYLSTLMEPAVSMEERSLRGEPGSRQQLDSPQTLEKGVQKPRIF